MLQPHQLRRRGGAGEKDAENGGEKVTAKTQNRIKHGAASGAGEKSAAAREKKSRQNREPDTSFKSSHGSDLNDLSFNTMRVWWNGRHSRLKICRRITVWVQVPPPAPKNFTIISRNL